MKRASRPLLHTETETETLLDPSAARSARASDRSVAAALLVGAAALLASAATGCQAPRADVVVASKMFTEGELLADLAALSIEDAGYRTAHQRRLGGTLVCFEALESGSIDLYADYTGTLLQSTFSDLDIEGIDGLERELERRGLRMSKPLGFNNTYALGMLRERAQALDIKTISDLRKHLDLEFGFSPEFTQRADSWPGLRQHYGLTHERVTTMQHELSYAALAAGDIDVMDIYSTDAKIDRFDIVTLADDQSFFPNYQAVYVYRADLTERVPEIASLLGRLEGKIDEPRAVAMNAQADLNDVPEPMVAAAFLRQELGIETNVALESTTDRVVRNTLEHLLMVIVAMLMGIVVAVPIGFLAYKRPPVGMPILGMLGILLTIPSLALLVFMLPFFGIGLAPAIAALFLYCLLPIAWNTYTGLKAIPPRIDESAEAIGLSPWAKVVRIELPLAARSIMAGIKISAVLTIGFAALGGFIGAGGYGEPIYNALQDNKPDLALIGAIPAAAMALITLALGELAERALIPRGLRLRRAS
ncbi:MAG: glycine betaine ABC transporter substrate-binding protein [Haliangiales bacterium]